MHILINIYTYILELWDLGENLISLFFHWLRSTKQEKRKKKLIVIIKNPQQKDNCISSFTYFNPFKFIQCLLLLLSLSLCL